MSRKHIVAIVLLIALLVPATRVTAQPYVPPPPYVQINNGTIYTNSGQRFQAVVQFGNRSNLEIWGAVLSCGLAPVYWGPDHLEPAELGTILTVQRGPYPNIAMDSERTWFFSGRWYYDEYGDYYVPGHQGIRLIPGQNYNVAFDVHVNAPPGTEFKVCCWAASMYQDIDEWPESETEVTVKVR